MSDWQSELSAFLENEADKKIVKELKLVDARGDVATFFAGKVTPAFAKLKTELEKHGREVDVSVVSDSGTIKVAYADQLELDYTVAVHVHPGSASPYTKIRFRDSSDGKRYVSEGGLRTGIQNYTVADITEDEIIKSFLATYKSHVFPRK